MRLDPLGDGLLGVLPAWLSLSSMPGGGQWKAGEHVIFPDDNATHNPANPVWAYNMPTPRTHGWVVFQTGHLNIWTSSDFGTGAGSDASNSDADHPMVGTWFTGSTTTGHISIGPGANVNLFSATSHQQILEAIFMIPVLSNGTDAFNVRFGYADVIAGAVANGAYWEVDSNVAATGNFVTASSSTRTSVVCGPSIVAGTWYRLRIVVTNASKADCYFTTEGTALPSTPTVSTTTNIPSGTGHPLAPSAFIEKNAGTTTKTLAVLHVIAACDRLAA